MMGDLKTMGVEEFVRRLRARAAEADCHYVFWLGAGCSVTSGIPAAAALVRDDWLPKLHRLKGEPLQDLERWTTEEFSGSDRDDLGTLYGPVMQALFPLPDQRQRETERLCEGRVPGFAYGVLAALMSRQDGVFSAAVTTNFDDLITDAMYVFGETRPLVIEHEALSGFVRPGRVRRPLAIKIHGDHRLSPLHTASETRALEANIAEGVRGVLQDRGVIFVGYAGNDRGVIAALEELPPNALPLGVWWVSRREPSGAIRDWLVSRGATWVSSAGFDELMLLFRDEFGIEHPTATRFEKIIASYRSTYERLTDRVEDLAERGPESDALKRAAHNANQAASDWWGVELAAQRLMRTDPPGADAIYTKGVERYPDARLVGNYANFVADTLGDPDRAQELYEQAITADPKNATNLNNYAIFLKSVRKDYDRAKALFERAIAAEPDNANALAAYGIFLTDVRNDHDRAQELYERAIAADPTNANALVVYAIFLRKVRKEHDRAQELYERAIAADPENANALGAYALFLNDVRSDHDRAQELYEQATTADPNHAVNLGNYGIFLKNVRNDHDRAQELYEQAIAADPDNANALGAYALFLKNVRKDHDRAQELYERAIEADPDNAANLGNYAVFLADVRHDDDRAQELYERTIDADPESAHALGAYALFLTKVRRDHERAQELYERAIAADPDHANTLGNYSRLLFERGDDDRANALAQEALKRGEHPSLRAEVSFYLSALGRNEPGRAAALRELSGLVRAGHRTPDWDFSRIVARAKTVDPGRAAWLAKLAQVLSQGADESTLHEWSEWPGVGS